MSGVATLQEEGSSRGCSAHAMPGQFELVLMSKAGPALYILQRYTQHQKAINATKLGARSKASHA
jgi:hypothetical protein